MLVLLKTSKPNVSEEYGANILVTAPKFESITAYGESSTN
jgi:hypothetical protein